MTSHNKHFRRDDCVPDNSIEISIDSIVNKDQDNEWEARSVLSMGSQENKVNRNEQGLKSLPSISQLCLVCMPKTPHTIVEEQEVYHLPCMNGLRESSLDKVGKVQQPLDNSEMDRSGKPCLSQQDGIGVSEYSNSEDHSSSQGTSSFNDTTCSRASRKSDENSKAKRQLAKKLWRQRDQMKREEEKLIFQRKEQSFQEAIREWIQSHSDEWNEERLLQVSKELFQQEAGSSRVEGIETMPVLHGSAFDLITKQRHRIEKRLPPGALEQLPEEEIRKRRNEQKSASKWRAMQLQTEKMHLLRWNCRLLEELYKYIRKRSEVP
ncbi:hypothetical protein Gasu2_15700 [Galdieria sulphuraria]|uniref:Uncharacterized protein n=1 Tax=Galdieria sulphuraria TaxID=130081 RepID=M2XSX2_GALSU|nr:uncharacterized protein Gasu_58480 [Galdieria sulphuraria]EME26524.1 hypothetical protein Gasu_58480 [Galdieria sulphuraria]GJD07198.1 hypothetical protein Gasu2_15700 [Galdieria sulphuraria]|eukprot:XP_005703044.1 hypothetical protein Gasu_58480 [Galdieria sulphuraria]